VSIKHNGYTFSCDLNWEHDKLFVEAKTERTAIEKARARHWDVLRVRATAGVRANKVARTIRLVCCPGCAATVGVRFR
jgi:hypothetical protein